jgi:glutamyl-Q tRNA(Asp) synthetase
VAIYQALGLPPPQFAHVPLLTEPDGSKLAKSRRSLPLAQLAPRMALAECLGLLGIEVPRDLKAAPVNDMLHWSVQHWRPLLLSGRRAVALPN